ncbi:MAG: polysaccharide biosynthesis/export family protein [Parachlamydiales bacterium]
MAHTRYFFIFFVLFAGVLCGQEETLWEPPAAPINHIDLPDIVIETIEIGSQGAAASNPLFPEAPSASPVIIEDEKQKAHSESDSADRETSGEYRLRIGDTLVVSIYGEPNSTRTVNIDPTGCMSFLFVNALQVKGLTIGEARLALQRKLKKYYKTPLVSITLTDYAGYYYSILGEVRQPGRYRIKGHSTILTAVAQSAGFKTQEYRFETYDQADLKRSFLARNNDYYPVDFERLIKRGDTSQDVDLENGDYIYIAPSYLDRVFVLGEVRRPVFIQYLHTISLAEALAEAGGLNFRASSRVAILRGSLCSPTQYLIDINRILKGYACDFTLEPGDIIYVPPFRFNTMKEIVKSAIRTFVGTVASVAGTRAFIAITPAADDADLIQPIPIINTGGNIITPVTPFTPQF